MTERFRKTIPFTAVLSNGPTTLEGVQFTLDKNGGQRQLYTAAGRVLHKRIGSGKLVHAETKLQWDRDRLLAVRAPEGIIVAYYEAYTSMAHVGYIPMCRTYLKRLGFARAAQRRWYRVVGT